MSNKGPIMFKNFSTITRPSPSITKNYRRRILRLVPQCSPGKRLSRLLTLEIPKLLRSPFFVMLLLIFCRPWWWCRRFSIIKPRTTSRRRWRLTSVLTFLIKIPLIRFPIVQLPFPVVRPRTPPLAGPLLKRTCGRFMILRLLLLLFVILLSSMINRVPVWTGRRLKPFSFGRVLKLLRRLKKRVLIVIQFRRPGRIRWLFVLRSGQCLPSFPRGVPQIGIKKILGVKIMFLMKILVRRWRCRPIIIIKSPVILLRQRGLVLVIPVKLLSRWVVIRLLPCFSLRFSPRVLRLIRFVSLTLIRWWLRTLRKLLRTRSFLDLRTRWTVRFRKSQMRVPRVPVRCQKFRRVPRWYVQFSLFRVKPRPFMFVMIRLKFMILTVMVLLFVKNGLVLTLLLTFLISIMMVSR